MPTPEQYAALHDSAGVLDRSSRGRLMLAGRDRRSYLQGLLTNDVEALTSGTGCYAAYLTAQGRMIADARLFELGDSLLVDVEPHMRHAVRERWEMFIFSEDVSISDVTDSTAQVGIYGPASAAILSRAQGGDAPGPGQPSAEALEALPLYGSLGWTFRGQPAHVLRRDDIGVMGFDVVLPAALSTDLIAALREGGALAIDEETADTTRIEAGIPVFGRDMDETTIPLEAGIEDRAISLTKGCYVGQEIIIRVLHRGHGRVARKLVTLAFDPGATPAAGDKITSGDREIGHLTSVTFSPHHGRPIALGYVHRDFTAPATAVTAGQAAATVLTS